MPALHGGRSNSGARVLTGAAFLAVAGGAVVFALYPCHAGALLVAPSPLQLRAHRPRYRRWEVWSSEDGAEEPGAEHMPASKGEHTEALEQTFQAIMSSEQVKEDVNAQALATPLNKEEDDAEILTAEEMYEKVFAKETGFLKSRLNPMRDRERLRQLQESMAAGEVTDLGSLDKKWDEQEFGDPQEVKRMLRESIRPLEDAFKFPTSKPLSKGQHVFRNAAMKGEAGFQTTSNKFKDKLAHGMKDSIPITPGALLSDSDENEFKRRDEETQLRIAAISKEIENDEEIFKNQILCPRCGSPAGQEELQRWGHCGMCRQADISEPLVDMSVRYALRGLPGSDYQPNYNQQSSHRRGGKKQSGDIKQVMPQGSNQNFRKLESKLISLEEKVDTLVSDQQLILSALQSIQAHLGLTSQSGPQSQVPNGKPKSESPSTPSRHSSEDEPFQSRPPIGNARRGMGKRTLMRKRNEDAEENDMQ